MENPNFPHAQRLLKEAIFEGEMIPAMVEIIGGQLHSFHCEDGEFGWYPITYKQLKRLLEKRARNTGQLLE